MHNLQKYFDSCESDLLCIEEYNARRKSNSKTKIQVHMKPSPFDGDPFTARIVLLMNNPGFDPLTSSPLHHSLSFSGWPLAGLHPDAPSAFRKWYERPFGYLLRQGQYPAKMISNRIAIIQLCPWASEEFDVCLELPSRQQQVELAQQAVKRGAIVIIGRSIDAWRDALGVGPFIFNTRSVRNPRISPGCLPSDAWPLIEEAMYDDT